MTSPVATPRAIVAQPIRRFHAPSPPTVRRIVSRPMARLREVLKKAGLVAKDRDVLVTGLPRSGTTLTCHLLQKLPDTVALHEPMDFHKFSPERSRDDMCRDI